MKLAVVFIGLVLVVQNVCGSSIYGHNLFGDQRASYNEQDMCGREQCVPMVVRPRDLPKPVVPVPILGLSAVPGPCIHKKAIVKPAVIPKPIFRNQQPVIDVTHVGGNYHHLSSSSAYSSYGNVVSTGGNLINGDLSGNGLLNGPTVLNGLGVGGVVGGVVGGAGSYGNGAYGGSYGTAGGAGGLGLGGGFISGPVGGTPADAVSVALAYKMARQQQHQQSLSEDKLSFGFRKLPIEMPQRKIVKANVPEENLFSLNGQIVELKPVNIDTQRSLDEEAAEDLLALEEEEDDDVANKREIKKIYLEEIGYAPTKAKSAGFVDVPGTVGAGLVDAAGLGGGAGEAAAASEASSHGHGCGCCKTSNCKEFLPGNVEYRVSPKVEDIVLPAVQPPDSCESAELDISHEKCECQCKCLPICVKNCHRCSQSNVFMQKLSSV